MGATRLWRQAARSRRLSSGDGWREQGLLVVAANDDRLSWPEQQLVRELGEKLYGNKQQRREAERG